MNIGKHNLENDGTFIIAEVGSNHNQSKSLAYETIDCAIECGANAVKFQSINIDELYFRPSVEIKKLHRKIDLDEMWHYDLKRYCDNRGITFFSTPTYLKAIYILEDINVELFKLASAQIGTFPQLVEKVISLKKPVIFSTGLATPKILNKIFNLFKKHNNPNHILLHCNSIYPTPYEKINLRRMKYYSEAFKTIVGFSDHSIGSATAISAVSLGAKVIEKHFTLNKSLPVPDASFSLDPKEFKLMVEGIRIAEKALGSKNRFDLEPEELEFKTSITTRLVVKKNVKKGDLVRRDDFDYLRSNNGIDCLKLEEIIYSKASYNKDINEIRELYESDITY